MHVSRSVCEPLGSPDTADLKVRTTSLHRQNQFADVTALLHHAVRLSSGAKRESGVEMTPRFEEIIPAREPRPDQAFDESELAERLMRAVDELPAARQAVVRLHLQGYHRDEIAGLLGWTEAKTRNLLYRGLDDLRALLAKRGIGPGAVV